MGLFSSRSLWPRNLRMSLPVVVSKSEPLKEGSAVINFTKGEVFYNPVQQFNRDLSVSAVTAHALLSSSIPSKDGSSQPQGLKIFEGLSATGLRSIRYAREIPGVTSVIANDLDPVAVESIQRNIQINGEDDPQILAKVRTSQGDANTVLHGFPESVDVVDLDPYGSAVPFIDAAVQRVKSGGIVCVTCTDLAVLCATHEETCFSKYGGLPLRGDACHEGALRLVLQALETSANRYRRHIVPLLSCSIDFYVRMFVRIVESPVAVKLSATKRGIVGKCTQCRTVYQQPFMKTVSKSNKELLVVNKETVPQRCEICDSRVDICGPMWLGPLHDLKFVEKVLEVSQNQELLPYLGTRDRIKGMLSVISEELHVPFFHSLTEMASFLKISVPSSRKIRSALLNGGFQVSGSHCNPQALKSTAPPSFIWRCVFESTVEKGASDRNDTSTPVGSMMARINLKEALPINFTDHPGAEPPSKKLRLKRFPENPTKYWGPLARAKQHRNDRNPGAADASSNPSN